MPSSPKPSTNKNLFGESDVKKEVKPHTIITEFWCHQWTTKYHYKYPFTRRDGRHIKQLLEVAGSIGKAQAIILAYLTTNDSFLVKKGHQLRHLIADLPRFVKFLGDRGDDLDPLDQYGDLTLD